MKDEPKTLTPKLRFPEFKDGPGWEEGKLGDVISTITPPKKLPTTSYRAKGSIPIVDQSPESVCGWTDDAEAVIESPHPLIVFGDHTCVLKLVRGPFAQGADGIKIFHSVPLIDTEYLFHNLSNRPLIMEDYKRHFSILKERRVHYPDPRTAEQRKIAACLTSLDDRFAVEERKLQALRAHKKGLIQQLFPRDGESRPLLRFPEFRDGPEWEPRELGPLTTKVGSGLTPLGGEKNYKITGRPFIRSQNVGWGELILDDVAYIDEETHRSFDATELAVSDVLLNITGASIGRSAVADARILGGNVNQHVCIIRVNEEELSPGLLNQYLISDRGQKQIDSFQAGGNRQGLNFGQIRSFEIPLPSTVAEQQRIAACLSSLDALIAAHSQKLDGLRAHKKGLMQQLFPSPERV